MEIRIFRHAERIRLRILHRLSRADFYLELIPFVIEPKRLATPLSGFALSNRLHISNGKEMPLANVKLTFQWYACTNSIALKENLDR